MRKAQRLLFLDNPKVNLVLEPVLAKERRRSFVCAGRTES